MPVSALLNDGEFAVVFQTLQGTFFEKLDVNLHVVAGPTLITATVAPWATIEQSSGANFAVVWDSGANSFNPDGLSQSQVDASGAVTASNLNPTSAAPSALAFTSDASLLNTTDRSVTAVMPDGGYVKETSSQSQTVGAIHIQRFDAQGNAVGADHGASTGFSLTAYASQGVTQLANGGYAAAYFQASSHGSQELSVAMVDAADNQTHTVVVAHYDPPPGGGVAAGAADAALAGLPDGGFAVAWVQTSSSGGSDGSLMLREFRADGSPTSPTQTLGPADFSHPTRLVALANGQYAVSWTAADGTAQQQVYTEAAPSLGATNDTLLISDPTAVMPDGAHNATLVGAGPQAFTGNAFANRISNAEAPAASTLSGGAGADTLIAGRHADVLTGGEGADHFGFGHIPLQAGHITDFTDGVDKLDVSVLLGPDAEYAGTDPIGDGYISVVDDGAGNARLMFDADGRGSQASPVLVTTLDHVAAASITDSDLVGYADPTPPPPPPPPAGGQVIQGQANETGGAGNDTLVADFISGQQTLTGGAGADAFQIKSIPANPDHITDFVIGTDKLDLSAILAKVGYTGSDPVADGYVRLVTGGVGDGTFVYVDTDGPGTQDQWGTFVVQLQNVSSGASFGRSQLTWAQLEGAGPTSPPPPPPVSPPPPPPPPADGQVIQGQANEMGGAGNDTLVADFLSGRQTLTGGAGDDSFQFNAIPANPDHITDFTIGADKLDLSAILSHIGYTGSDPVADGYVRLVTGGVGDGTFVYVDTDGHGSQDQWGTYVVQLQNVSSGPSFGASQLTWAQLEGPHGGSPPVSPPPPPPPPPPADGVVLTSTSDFPGSTMMGGAGNDTLNAGRGSDTMTGGAGDDHFIFKVAPWSPAEVTDFTHGQDVLDLRGMFANTGYAGSNPVADHYLLFLADGSGGTKVLFDADGSGPGQASYVIHLDHVDPASMTASDWIVH